MQLVFAYDDQGLTEAEEAAGLRVAKRGRCEVVRMVPPPRGSVDVAQTVAVLWAWGSTDANEVAGLAGNAMPEVDGDLRAWLALQGEPGHARSGRGGWA